MTHPYLDGWILKTTILVPWSREIWILVSLTSECRNLVRQHLPTIILGEFSIILLFCNWVTSNHSFGMDQKLPAEWRKTLQRSCFDHHALSTAAIRQESTPSGSANWSSTRIKKSWILIFCNIQVHLKQTKKRDLSRRVHNCHVIKFMLSSVNI